MAKKKGRRQNDPNQGSGQDSTESGAENNSELGQTCVHMNRSVNLNGLRKVLKTAQDECQGCLKGKAGALDPLSKDDEIFVEEKKPLLVCLKCGNIACGPQKVDHALQHYKTPRSDVHSMALNRESGDVWCYECDRYLPGSSSRKLQECVEWVQKQFDDRRAVPPRSPKDNGVILELEPHNESESGETERKTAVIKKRTMGDVSQLPSPRGLSNLGNTCFFNSVLQCLAQAPHFLSALELAVMPEISATLPPTELNVEDETVSLPSLDVILTRMGPLTTALLTSLKEIKSGSSGPYSPGCLLDQVRKHAHQFQGYNQQDAHELLRHLLDGVRNENLKRYQGGILQALGLSQKVDPRQVSSDVKKKVRAYGLVVSEKSLLLPDIVFGGRLVSALTCQVCGHTSLRREQFLDLSLPVLPDKPQPPVHRRKASEEDLTFDVSGNSSRPSKYQLKKEKRQARKGKKQQRSGSASQKPDEENGETGSVKEKDSGTDMSDADVEDNVDVSTEVDSSVRGGGAGDVEVVCQQMSDLYLGAGNTDVPHVASITDVPHSSTCENIQEGTVDDKEVVEPSLENKEEVNGCGPAILVVDSEECPRTKEEGDSPLKSIETSGKGDAEEGELGNESEEAGERCKETPPSTQISQEEDEEILGNIRAVLTLAPRSSVPLEDYSVLSGLAQFTAPELLTGSNKVECERCSKGEGEAVKRPMSKTFLIGALPAVLTLQLKRFDVGGGALRKVTRRVAFPMILDLAPFCSDICREEPTVSDNQSCVLYSLFGVVEHSGRLTSGHYTAYVKIRPEVNENDARSAFTPGSEKRHLSESEVEPPRGNWYHISDSAVSTATEERVLFSQAYLLFYERIV